MSNLLNFLSQYIDNFMPNIGFDWYFYRWGFPSVWFAGTLGANVASKDFCFDETW